MYHYKDFGLRLFLLFTLTACADDSVRELETSIQGLWHHEAEAPDAAATALIVNEYRFMSGNRFTYELLKYENNRLQGYVAVDSGLYRLEGKELYMYDIARYRSKNTQTAVSREQLRFYSRHDTNAEVRLLLNSKKKVLTFYYKICPPAALCQPEQTFDKFD